MTDRPFAWLATPPFASCAAVVGLVALVALAACAPRAVVTPEAGTSGDPTAAYDPAADSLRFTGETHLRNVRQLTFGGNNAEAYWSRDDQSLIFQSDWAAINGRGCDQQFTMAAAPAATAPSTARYRRVSPGTGRTTCGYFLPDGRVLFASTHASGPACPPPAAAQRGRYVWSIYETYDIYTANADGSNVQPLLAGPGYDAEATVSPDGRYVVFTSTRGGDLDLWRYSTRTRETVQLTDTPGYDGGAFFSRDSQKLVWRASRPAGEDLAAYRGLLAQGLVEPKELDVYVADADGANARQVTDLPGANWAPFFHPDGERIVFASNHRSLERGGREFALYLVGVDGTGLTQLTQSGTFDAFPMFSYDGRRLVFSSNRNGARTPSRDTNVFVADWVETPGPADLNFRSAR